MVDRAAFRRAAVLDRAADRNIPGSGVDRAAVHDVLDRRAGTDRQVARALDHRRGRIYIVAFQGQARNRQRSVVGEQRHARQVSRSGDHSCPTDALRRDQRDIAPIRNLHGIRRGHEIVRQHLRGRRPRGDFIIHIFDHAPQGIEIMVLDFADCLGAVGQVDLCFRIQGERDGGIIRHFHRAGGASNDGPGSRRECIVFVPTFGDGIVSPAKALDPYPRTVHHSERNSARFGFGGRRCCDRRALSALRVIALLRNRRGADGHSKAGVAEDRVLPALGCIHRFTDLEIVAAFRVDGIDGRRPVERKIRPCRFVKAVLQRIVLHLELHGEAFAYVQRGDVRRSFAAHAQLYIAQIALIQAVVQHGRHAEIVPGLADGKA